MSVRERVAVRYARERGLSQTDGHVGCAVHDDARFGQQTLPFSTSPPLRDAAVTARKTRRARDRFYREKCVNEFYLVIGLCKKIQIYIYVLIHFLIKYIVINNKITYEVSYYYKKYIIKIILSAPEQDNSIKTYFKKYTNFKNALL